MYPGRHVFRVVFRGGLRWVGCFFSVFFSVASADLGPFLTIKLEIWAKSKAGKIAQGLPEVRIVLLLFGSAIRKQKYKEFFARIPVNQQVLGGASQMNRMILLMIACGLHIDFPKLHSRRNTLRNGTRPHTQSLTARTISKRGISFTEYRRAKRDCFEPATTTT